MSLITAISWHIVYSIMLHIDDKARANYADHIDDSAEGHYTDECQPT
jgi:hypothetical protein